MIKRDWLFILSACIGCTIGDFIYDRITEQKAIAGEAVVIGASVFECKEIKND